MRWLSGFSRTSEGSDGTKMDERQRILGLLESGKINANEAARLLDALGTAARSERVEVETRPQPRFIRILVSGERDEKVDVKVPLRLLRAGIKLGAVIPQHARYKIEEKLSERGIQLDLSSLNDSTLDDLVESLADLSVDVEDGPETVRVFCE